MVTEAEAHARARRGRAGRLAARTHHAVLQRPLKLLHRVGNRRLGAAPVRGGKLFLDVGEEEERDAPRRLLIREAHVRQSILDHVVEDELAVRVRELCIARGVDLGENHVRDLKSSTAAAGGRSMRAESTSAASREADCALREFIQRRRGGLAATQAVDETMARRD